MGILFIIFVFLTIICLIKLVIDYDDSVYIVSDVDKRSYLIRNKYHSSHIEKETADTLAEINNRVERLIGHISGKNQKYYVKYLRQNYSSGAISEAAIDDNYTTYTINKQHIHICLRSRDLEKRLYDMNDLMYVTIHELAHMCNYTKDGRPINGHGKEFQEIFKYLIDQAIDIDIYQYYDYTTRPKEYCGMNITSHI